MSDGRYNRARWMLNDERAQRHARGYTPDPVTRDQRRARLADFTTTTARATRRTRSRTEVILHPGAEGHPGGNRPVRYYT